MAPLGLTSARWQIIAAERPQPVAWLARDLGASRQNVQRIVNDLEKEGHVVFAPNPHHRGAQLVVLTGKGWQAFDASMRLWEPRADDLAEGLSVEDLETAHLVIIALRKKLEGNGEAEE